MHVLSVIHYPVFGGPHNRNMRLAPVLAKQGISTTVLLPAEQGNAAKRLRAAGIRVIEIPLRRIRATKNVREQAKFLGRFPWDVWAIRALIKREKIDVVQLNGLVNPHGALAARSAGVPVVWQILDTYTPMSVRRMIAPLLRSYADVVMCTGKEVAKAHPGALRFGARLLLFNPPVDLVAFAPNANKRRRARESLGLPADVPVVGTVGNVNRQKGHLTFVETADMVRQSRPDVRFVILGAVHQNHADHVSRVQESIARAGFTLGQDFVIRDPGSGVADLLPAFDFFCMTSEPNSEGLPTAIQEAMACGLPVVSTDVGSISELVNDGRTGFLVPARDARTLATKILELLSNPEVACAMSEEAIRVATAFSVERCAELHVRAYRMALGIRGQLAEPES